MYHNSLDHFSFDDANLVSENLLSRVSKNLEAKGLEYSVNGERLSNIKAIAKLVQGRYGGYVIPQGNNPLGDLTLMRLIIFILKSKHTISIDQDCLLDAILGMEDDNFDNYIEEKVGDQLTYDILDAMTLVNYHNTVKSHTERYPNED
jgi:hypothetical protein